MNSEYDRQEKLVIEHNGKLLERIISVEDYPNFLGDEVRKIAVIGAASFLYKGAIHILKNLGEGLSYVTNKEGIEYPEIFEVPDSELDEFCLAFKQLAKEGTIIRNSFFLIRGVSVCVYEWNYEVMSYQDVLKHETEFANIYHKISNYTNKPFQYIPVQSLSHFGLSLLSGICFMADAQLKNIDWNSATFTIQHEEPESVEIAILGSLLDYDGVQAEVVEITDNLLIIRLENFSYYENENIMKFMLEEDENLEGF